MAQTINLVPKRRNQRPPEVKGWGVDLAPENRPGVAREAAPARGTGAHWTEPERQVPRIPIFKSLERGSLTPVFGTSCPPKGLSGKLRELAYRMSEAKAAHWMTLLVADRIDMLESLVGSFLRGRPDNPLKEIGLREELDHRPKLRRGLVAAAALTTLGGSWWLTRRQPRTRSTRTKRRARSEGIAA